MDELLLKENRKKLTDIVEKFCAFFQQEKDYEIMIYKYWSAKDVLGHVTFWHESFARNLLDLSKGTSPSPLKGKLSELNKFSVVSTKSASIISLLERLKQAQKLIEEHILNDKVDKIPYKKGSRDYDRLEHLQIVTGHISKHLKDLNKVSKV